MIRCVALLSLVLPLATSAGAAIAAEQQASVPARFQGEWISNLKNCGTNLDDSKLTISAERIRFYESRGSIKAVVTQGESDLALITELSGEGDIWLAYNHFRLSPDLKSLTDVTDATGESKLVRYRCPKSAK
jgi:hypothetical protein